MPGGSIVAMTLRVNATHSHADRGLDAYWTPPQATRALMAIERLPQSIADPCCGSGAILDVLRDEGDHIVFGADVVNYGWLHCVVRDYLAEPVTMNETAIVTNPPYRLALEFIEKAHREGTQYSAWLLRLNFLESMRRKSFFEANPPSRPHIFRDGSQCRTGSAGRGRKRRRTSALRGSCGINKARRNDFKSLDWPLDRIKAYTIEELRKLSAAVTVLRKAAFEDGIRLRRLDGAGNLSAGIMRKENVMRHYRGLMKKFNADEEQLVGFHAGFGGRIELIQQGFDERGIC